MPNPFELFSKESRKIVGNDWNRPSRWHKCIFFQCWLIAWENDVEIEFKFFCLAHSPLSFPLSFSRCISTILGRHFRFFEKRKKYHEIFFSKKGRRKIRKIAKYNFRIFKAIFCLQRAIWVFRAKNRQNLAISSPIWALKLLILTKNYSSFVIREQIFIYQVHK